MSAVEVKVGSAVGSGAVTVFSAMASQCLIALFSRSWDVLVPIAVFLLRKSGFVSGKLCLLDQSGIACGGRLAAYRAPSWRSVSR